DKDNNGNIYAASIGSQNGSGIFKSTDDGTTWNKMWSAETGMNCVYVDENNTVYVGLNYTSTQSGIYRSNDGGNNWQKIFNETENVYAITKLSSGRILAASYGQVFYSDDNGGTWVSTSSGLVSSTPSAFAIRNQDEVFMSTLGYGIYKSTDNGATWTNMTGAGPDYSCLITNSDGSMYAGTRGSWVYKSDDGDNWTLVNSGMGNDKYVLSLLTTKAGYLFVGMDVAGLFRSVEKIVTDVNENTEYPTKFALSQNYPNPFNPSTVIKYSIPTPPQPSSSQGEGVREGFVTLKIYDILGREVATLVNKEQKPGSYKVEWDATNEPSGVYFYRLNTGNFVETKKMILLR
ncbi:hypothetical protein MNBD_IGNAVI01-2056, partial [hydrothermal vent metagenome]